MVIQRCSSAGLLHEALHGVNSGLRFARTCLGYLGPIRPRMRFYNAAAALVCILLGKVGVVDCSGQGDRTDQALNIRSASICEEAFGNLAVAVVA